MPVGFEGWVGKGFVTAGSGLYFHKPEINGEVDELRRRAFQEGYKVGQDVGHR